MNLGSSTMEYCGKSMSLEKKEKRTKKKTFLLPEDELDYYLTYQVRPIARTLIERDPAEGAQLEKIRERVIVELDRMRREYQATGRVAHEKEVTDDEQEEVEKVEKKKVDDGAEVTVAATHPPIIAVGRSGRRRFRQGIVRRAGGDYEKIV
jgi:hypothetical protein